MNNSKFAFKAHRKPYNQFKILFGILYTKKVFNALKTHLIGLMFFPSFTEIVCH